MAESGMHHHRTAWGGVLVVLLVLGMVGCSDDEHEDPFAEPERRAPFSLTQYELVGPAPGVQRGSARTVPGSAWWSQTADPNPPLARGVSCVVTQEGGVIGLASVGAGFQPGGWPRAIAYRDPDDVWHVRPIQFRKALTGSYGRARWRVQLAAPGTTPTARGDAGERCAARFVSTRFSAADEAPPWPTDFTHDESTDGASVTAPLSTEQPALQGVIEAQPHESIRGLAGSAWFSQGVDPTPRTSRIVSCHVTPEGVIGRTKVPVTSGGVLRPWAMAYRDARGTWHMGETSDDLTRELQGPAREWHVDLASGVPRDFPELRMTERCAALFVTQLPGDSREGPLWPLD